MLVALGQFALLCCCCSSLGTIGKNLPGGLLGSSPWSVVCSLSRHPPAPTQTPKLLGQRQPLTPNSLGFLHKRQGSDLAQGVELGAAAGSSSLAGLSSVLCPCLTLSTGLGKVTQS